MTGQEMYAKVKRWTFDKLSSPINDEYILEAINRVLAELFMENNMMRIAKDKTPLLSIPQYQMDTLSEEIPYEDEYVYSVIPVGVGAYLLIDDDLGKYSIYTTDYNNLRVLNQRLNSTERIERAYADAV